LRPWALLEPQHGQFSFVVVSVQWLVFLVENFLQIVRERRMPVQALVRWVSLC
jgi:hypothetical protein